MHLTIMEFFRLGWLIVEYIFFWCFIYVHYISNFKQNSLPYVLGTPLDFTTIYYYRNALNVFQGYQSGFILCLLIFS
jgi:hypothetical protein